MNPQLQQFWAG